jgi:molybdopterin-containing oxidoreductase family membrane subunit
MPQWGTYVMTFWDAVILLGSFGQFMTLFLLFCRVLPVCNMSEIKAFHPDTLRQIRESHDHE